MSKQRQSRREYQRKKRRENAINPFTPSKPPIDAISCPNAGFKKNPFEIDSIWSNAIETKRRKH
jgi:hypothetical protein